MIQKPEDLPESQTFNFLVDWEKGELAIRQWQVAARRYVPDFYEEIGDFFDRGSVHPKSGSQMKGTRGEASSASD